MSLFSIFKRKEQEIELSEFNNALDYLFYMLVNERLLNLSEDLSGLEAIKSAVWTASEENREAARFMRADYAAYLLSELEPKYFALMDRERQIDIARREKYIYSLIQNELGYEGE